MKKTLILLAFACALTACNSDKKNHVRQPSQAEMQPLNEEEQFEKAIGLMQDMKVNEAIAILEKIAATGEQKERALCGIGGCYLMKQEPEKALAAYEKALKTDPEYYAALIGVGSACLDLKRYDQALEYFRLARQNNTEYPDSYHGLAIAFDRTNQPDSALHNAKISLEKDPDAEHDYDVQQIMKKYNK